MHIMRVCACVREREIVATLSEHVYHNTLARFIVVYVTTVTYVYDIH